MTVAAPPTSVPAQWIRTASDERAVAEGCYFDEDAGLFVVEFFERFLRHSKGQWAGQPFVLLDWQRDDLIMPLFSWKRPDGARRFRKASVWIPKKNGKSTLAAGIGLYMLIADGEAGAEVYSLATDREQANIVHGEAIHMVEASPELTKRLRVNRSTRNIAFEKTNSWYRSLSSEHGSKEGLNIHCDIKDELHAWEHGRALYDTVRFGGAARRQPLQFEISTAGTFDPTAIGYEQYDYACKVRDGLIVDTSLFVYIAEASKNDDWASPDTWRKANPSYGVTIQEDEMAQACAEAKEKPRLENPFKRYRLNLWTEQVDRWLQIDRWDACGTGIPDADLVGRPCWGGLDCGSTNDLTSLSLCFPPTANVPTYDFLFWSWCPEETARERDRRNRGAYVDWKQRGFLEFTPGNVTDYGFIRKRLVELAKVYKIQDVGFDPWNATDLSLDLIADGVPMVEVRQGEITLNEPSKLLERLVLSGGLRHTGDPVTRWAVCNVTVRTGPTGNIKPDKEKSGDKIDPVVAGIIALARAVRTPTPGKSVYETRGLRTL